MFRAALILICTLLNAQNEPPTFRATSQLIEFSVVAQDKKGNPVLDLKEDFTLLDNGKPRSIAFFRYEGGGESAKPEKQPKLPAHVFTNRAVLGGGRVRNVTALLIDSANTETEDQMLVKLQSKELLNALSPQTLVGVFQMGREFRVLHDFTDDKSSLQAGLERLKVEFPIQRLTDVAREARERDALLAQMSSRNPGARSAEFERARIALTSDVNFNSSVRNNRVEATMRMLESVGAHIAGIPGRKTLVWISGGIGGSSIRVGPSGQFSIPVDAEQLQAAMTRTSQRLAQSGVVLYAVSARGLATPGGISAENGTAPRAGGGRFGSLTQADAYGQDTRAAFWLMSSITGGRYFVNTNDFSEAITKAQADLRGTYLVAFYGDGEADGKWRSLKATVNRPGVELLHRQGYQLVAGSDQGLNWSAEQMRSAMRNPLGSSAIRLNAHCMRGRGRDSNAVTLTVQVEPDDLFLREDEGRSRAELEVTVGEKTVTGEVQFQQDVIRMNFTPQQLAVARRKGIPYTKQWTPGPNTAVVRVLVRDKATDRVGTVDVRYD